MLSTQVKIKISRAVQNILQLVDDRELPQGEIHFILHIDGADEWSWANIRNEEDRDLDVPEVLVQNLTVRSS